MRATTVFFFLGGSLGGIIASTAALAQAAPAPQPARLFGAPSVAETTGTAAPPKVLTEWTLHKSADNQHPNGHEQMLVWLMNQARRNPSAEGVWLASAGESEIANSRDNIFHVNKSLLQSEFNQLPAKPPAAFDQRLYEAALQHTNYMIANDVQDSNGQGQRIIDQGFAISACAVSAFGSATSALNAHAALNIDWGDSSLDSAGPCFNGSFYGPSAQESSDGMQKCRGHRQSIMAADNDYTNVGFAVVAENNTQTQVGPLVTALNYCQANGAAANHYNRFLVGTVWRDANNNRRYDPGEGFGGVRVEPNSGNFFAITAPGGGYAIPITSAGTYQVTFSGGAIGPAYTRSVTVGSVSVRLDYTTVIYADGLEDTPPPY